MSENLFFSFLAGAFASALVGAALADYNKKREDKKRKAKEDNDYILNKIGYVKNDVINLESRFEKLVEKYIDLGERMQKLEEKEKKKC